MVGFEKIESLEFSCPVIKKLYETFHEDSYRPRNLVQIAGGRERAKVKSSRILNPSHPANGQNGLFSQQRISPGSFIIDYIGIVYYYYSPNENDPGSCVDTIFQKCLCKRCKAQSEMSEKSDYTLSFLAPYLAIDAGRRGNEARMINDYRGVAARPNARFDLYLKNGRLRMGVFALNNVSIERGQEILISYGKSFWSARNDLKG